MSENSALSSTLGLLSHLSIDELKEILNDNEKFEDMTKDTNHVAKDNESSEKEMLIASNKSLAEYNLSKSAEFLEKKSELVSLYEELREINQKVEATTTKLKELTNKSNSDSVLNLLQVAISEVELETDDIAEKFLNDEIKLEAYLDQYPSKRKLMHLRKAKYEKMTELINRRLSYKAPASASRSITTITQNVSTNIYPPNYSNAPVNVPYPVEPLNMPMPMPTMSTPFMHNHF